MARNTGIEWATDSLNPWWGCERISPACTNCYAAAMARRFSPEAAAWDGTVVKMAAHKIEKQLQNIENAKMGRRVFVGSMTDVALVAQRMPASLADILSRIYRIQWARANAPAPRPLHNFIILTKRPHLLLSFLERLTWDEETMTFRVRSHADQQPWPEGRIFPGLILGVTAENQTWAGRRIPLLLQMPMAQCYLVSAEPLLGPLDLRPWLFGTRRLGWVQTGGETGGKGTKTRPMNPAWIEALVQHTAEAGVPLFFKAEGDWVPVDEIPKDAPAGAWMGQEPHQFLELGDTPAPEGYQLMAKVPKKHRQNGVARYPTDAPPFPCGMRG